MTLPVSGAISLNNVNVELGRSGTQIISLGETAVRNLAGVPSGAISMNNLYGKSNRVSLSIIYSSSTYGGSNVIITSQPGYVANKTDLTITVDFGVWLASGLGVFTSNSGDTVTIINRGVIAGLGGNGGTISGSYVPPTAGQDALRLNGPAVFTVDNTYGAAWIAGGGGGGGGPGGGGGAGGGAGGVFGGAAGGSGGLIGSSGSDGGVNSNYRGGGGGGRILPGTGGSGPTTNGGGAGGGGAAHPQG
jgi:hypothetical protein